VYKFSYLLTYLLRSYKYVGIVEESIGIEVVAITPRESMEGLTVSMTVSE